ncbi:MAG: PKD domain-containing protein [Deltaproteobacteria bacterium]
MHIRLTPLLFALACPVTAWAQTVVPPGNLVGSQTWTPGASPYVLAGDLTVPAGITLTIQAGTTVTLGPGDTLGSGLDSARTELSVLGTIVVNGTPASPVTFDSGAVGPATSDFYGIVLQAGSTATLSNAVVEHGHRCVEDHSTGATITNVDAIDCSYGYYVVGGSPTITGGAIEDGSSYGIYATTNANVTASGLRVRNNSSYGVYALNAAFALTGSLIEGNGSHGVYYRSSSGSHTTSLQHNTIYDNGTYGVYLYEQSGTLTVTMRDNVVLDNSSTGVVRSGSPISTISHNLVYGHSTNYSGASPGTGGVTENPLLVNAASGDFRPTSRSGARMAASDGMDIGAFAYDGAVTPALVGHLFVNTTLTAAASPHMVTGDLTIEPNVTLTIEPGAVVRFASGTDQMGANADTSRTELRVAGTLVADGTTTLPIVMESAAASPSRGDWYGVHFLAGASSSIIDFASIRFARYGVHSNAPAGTTVQRTTIEESSSYGVYVTTGALDLDQAIVRDNSSYGVYYLNGSGSITGSQIYDNGSHGVYARSSSGSHNVSILGNTIAENGTYGAYLYEQSGTLTTTFRDNLVLSNSSTGVVRSGSPISTITYNLVWGHTTDYSGASPGTGGVTENPLVVDRVGRDFRVTSNSPARNHASDGTDIGAIAFDGTPTVGVQGHLYTNTTWSSVGGPIDVLGDITIEPGVTLTIAAGTELRFAAGADSMGGNAATDRTELIVLGRLVADGTTPSPVVFRSASTTPSRGDWYGVRLTSSAANSSIDNAEISHARYGVHSQAPNTTSVTQSRVHESSSYGMYIDSGALVVDGTRVYDNGSYGVYALNASATLTNLVVHENGSHGVYARSSSGSHNVVLNNLTVWNNGTYGVYLYEQSGTLTVSLRNSIVAENSSTGVVRSGSPISTINYNNVWGHTTDYSGASGGTGAISANPQFVNTMLDNFYLLPSSTSIDAADPTTAAASDFDGTARPLDGNGNTMAVPDLGAFEYNPSANRWPIADAGSDRVVTSGLPVAFDGTGSFDPDGTVMNYVWDFGDGSMASGATVMHTFAGGTDRTVTLTVTDNAGAIDVDAIAVEVNLPPNADAGPQRFADPAEIVTFNGNGSTDSDGTIVAYLWDFGDGANASGQSVTHQYATGGQYTVTLTVTDDDGATGVATTTANITGNDGAPPSIVHTPITAAQPAGTAVTISAEVTDSSGVASVALYFRTQGAPAFSAAPMGNTAGATYQVDIPAGSVAAPGVEYYIQATDSAASSNTGTNPPGAPGSVHTFTVAAPAGPSITHVPVGDGQAAGQSVGIAATVTSGTPLASVTLYYRTQGGSAFTSAPMTNTAGDDWAGQIPGAAVVTPAVEYYLEAVDTANPANTATHPVSMGAVNAFTVTASDTSPPTIVHTPVGDGQAEATDITVMATVTDGTGVASVELFYRVSGGGGFATAAMTNTSGDTWTGTIPAASVTQLGVDYYIAAADSATPSNAATDPTGAPGAFHGFTVMRQFTVSEGDLVVTEVMNDPTGSETDREWFELYNTTSSPIDIDGFTFTDLGTDSFTVNGGGPVVVPAGGYLVLGRNDDTAANGGVTVGYVYSGMALSNNDDEIIISAGPTEVDRVVYDAGATFPNTPGATISLDPDQLDYTSNDDGASWCVATSQLASGDFGTPGARNDPCVPIDDTDPPVVTHVPVADGQPNGVAIPVVVVATDASGVAVVEVYHRVRGAGAFDVATLTGVGGGTYLGEIPATSVTLAGVDYYIRAVDDSAVSNERFAPTEADAMPFTFDVTAMDGAGPSITHVPIADGRPSGVAVDVFARVLDPSGIGAASVSYRTGGGAWMTATMTDTGGGLYSGQIPADAVTTDGVEYFLAAEDTSANAAEYPVGGAASPLAFTVTLVDVDGPVITHTPVADGQPAGAAVPIVATVTDESTVAEVRVYFRATGTASFVSAAMTANGDTFTGEIPAALVTGGGVDYYLEATDASDDQNLSRDPEAAPMAVHSFTIAEDGADTEAPAILHLPETETTAGTPVSIVAEIVDASGVATAEVLYRAPGSSSFVSLTLENEAGTNRYAGTIPATAVVVGQLEYYLRARDGAPAMNEGTRPEAAPDEVFAISVTASTGTEPPPVDDGGCSCAAERSSRGGLWLAVGLLALVLRRRR